jgi:hypothetical protein
MFIQVIQGKVSDEAGLRRCLQQWQTELQAGAEGYLGTTSGFCADGTFLALARFESEQAARHNSQRPEQGTWWAETAKCFEGDVTFLDCPEVMQWLDGGSDDAAFVQVMEGHSRDRNRMHNLMTQNADRIQQLRPEIIGGTLSTFGDDGYVEAVYFRSEDEAREHERMDVPDDLRSALEEENELMGDVSFFDLREPMLVSARR